MVIAKWRFDGFYKDVDPQKVAGEILSISDADGRVTPEDMVNAARNGCEELHKCFEWDDAVAGEKYREFQARQILHNLVIDYKDEVKKNEVETRFFYSTGYSEGYKPLEIILRNEDEYEKLLEMARKELRAFKAKYMCLSELKPIMDAIAASESVS